MPTNRRLAMEKYRQLAGGYDSAASACSYTRDRRRAVEALCLRPGDAVLDVGCGTGLSFELVEDAIGTEGRLIGIDQSPEMLARAREKVESNRWRNVTLIEAPVQYAGIPVDADAILLCFTHDILQSSEALQNVFRRAKPCARVAAVGTKWARWWALPANLRVWSVAHHAMTTFEGLGRPWTRLQRFLPELRVEESACGTRYLAWGTVPGAGWNGCKSDRGEDAPPQTA